MVGGVAGQIGVPVTGSALWYAKGSVQLRIEKSVQGWTLTEYRAKLNAVATRSVMVSRQCNSTYNSSSSEIVQVRTVLKRTVVGDWRFDNLSGSHLQSQVTRLWRWPAQVVETKKQENEWINKKKYSQLKAWPITFAPLKKNTEIGNQCKDKSYLKVSIRKLFDSDVLFNFMVWFQSLWTAIGVGGQPGAPATHPAVKPIRQDPGFVMTLHLSLTVIYVKEYLSKYRCAKVTGPNASRVLPLVKSKNKVSYKLQCDIKGVLSSRKN